MFIAVMIITACQPKNETVTVDAVAEKDSIAKNLDKMYAAYAAKAPVSVCACISTASV